MGVIAFTKTKLPYGWLGNMSPHKIIYDNKEWKTSEALFHALRFDSDKIKELIRQEASPMGAKLVAWKYPELMVVKHLSDEDVRNMALCIRLKIEQHPELEKELLATGDDVIIEDVTSRGDKGSNLFWGAMLKSDGTWEGKNTLGLLWMELRAKLKNKNRKIILNRIKTPDGTILISHHRHDFNTYLDKNGLEYMVDGGTDYLRRYVHEEAPYEELTLYHDTPYEEIRKAFARGGRGKDGTEPLVYVPLCEMNDEWLNAVIDYIGLENCLVKDTIPNLYIQEIEYRKTNNISIPE